MLIQHDEAMFESREGNTNNTCNHGVETQEKKRGEYVKVFSSL